MEFKSIIMNIWYKTMYYGKFRYLSIFTFKGIFTFLTIYMRKWVCAVMQPWGMGTGNGWRGWLTRSIPDLFSSLYIGTRSHCTIESWQVIATKLLRKMVGSVCELMTVLGCEAITRFPSQKSCGIYLGWVFSNIF